MGADAAEAVSPRAFTRRSLRGRAQAQPPPSNTDNSCGTPYDCIMLLVDVHLTSHGFIRPAKECALDETPSQRGPPVTHTSLHGTTNAFKHCTNCKLIAPATRRASFRLRAAHLAHTNLKALNQLGRIDRAPRHRSRPFPSISSSYSFVINSVSSATREGPPHTCYGLARLYHAGLKVHHTAGFDAASTALLSRKAFSHLMKHHRC